MGRIPVRAPVLELVPVLEVVAGVTWVLQVLVP